MVKPGNEKSLPEGRLPQNKDVPTLFYSFNYSFECFWVVHCQISQNLTVKFDFCFLQQTHQLRIGNTVHSCTGVDTLNPQTSEFSLLRFTISVSVLKTFLVLVFRYSPYVATSSEVTSCGL